MSGRDRAGKAYDSGASRRRFEQKHPDSKLVFSAAGPERSLWNLAVRTTAAGVGLTSADAVARVTDTLARRAPSQSCVS